MNHKKHVYLTYKEILTVQARIAKGDKVTDIANDLNCSAQTIYAYHPRSKSYRPDLIRVRKSGGYWKQTGGNTAEPTPKVSGNTTAVVPIHKPTKEVKLSRDAEWYVLSAAEVFGKSPTQIVDEMVAACKILKAKTIHDE